MTETIFKGKTFTLQNVVNIFMIPFTQDSEGRLRERLYPQLPKTPVYTTAVCQQVYLYSGIILSYPILSYLILSYKGPEGWGGPTQGSQNAGAREKR